MENEKAYYFPGFSASEIAEYAKLTGDKNSIHQGQEPIVHGALIIGRISAAVWMAYGDGTVARSIEGFTIYRPVKVGEGLKVCLGEPSSVENSRFGEKRVPVKVMKRNGQVEKLVGRGTVTIILPS
jgi:acyl dehydratase